MRCIVNSWVQSKHWHLSSSSESISKGVSGDDILARRPCRGAYVRNETKSRLLPTTCANWFPCGFFPMHVHFLIEMETARCSDSTIYNSIMPLAETTFFVYLHSSRTAVHTSTAEPVFIVNTQLCVGKLCKLLINNFSAWRKWNKICTTTDNWL